MTAASAARGHVTDDDCKARCGTLRYFLMAILTAAALVIGCITYVWAGVRVVEKECQTATAQFGQHQAAEVERDKATYAIVERILKRLDTIDEKLDK